MMFEEWRSVLGWERFYEVSNAGNVRSIDRVRRNGPNGSLLIRGKPIKAAISTNGYWTVGLWQDGFLKRRTIHSMVLEAFIGPRPSGMQCCHNNNVKTDNRIGNLRYDTVLENFADKQAHGTQVCGERHHSAKLTIKEIVEIRQSYPDISQAELSRRYNVSGPSMAKIVHNISWKHVVVPK